MLLAMLLICVCMVLYEAYNYFDLNIVRQISIFVSIGAYRAYKSCLTSHGILDSWI